MPSLVDFRRGFGGIIATLSVVALTVSGVLTLSAQGTGRCLFTDAASAVSSTVLIGCNGNTGSVSSTSFTASVGTQSAPSINFNGSPTSGFYLDTANSVSISASGQRNFIVRLSGNFSTVPLQPTSDLGTSLGLSNVRWTTLFAQSASTTYSTSTNFYAYNSGSCSNPGYKFQGDPDTGIDTFVVGNSGVLSFCTDGVERGYITYTAAANSQMNMLHNGVSVALPAYSFIDDPNSGFSRGQTDGELNIISNGSVAAVFVPTSTQFFLGSSPTTTVIVGTSSTRRGCFVMGDSDGTGYTYLVVNNGAATFSTTPCNP